ncbi:MAG: S1 RNA-binding domain-containing protein [Chloroflexi bacterium]|nr:S1 RNA-binding domain-containing protein [Chloroflexota bacterium]
MNNLESTQELLNQEVAEETTNQADAATEAQEDVKYVHPMEALLNDDHYNFHELETGQTIEGTIVSIDSNGIMVDIGSKSEGIVPTRDLERVDADKRENLAVGETIFTQVVRPMSRDGHAILSLSRALAEYDWQHAAELLESQEIFEGVVNGYNKGGVIVYIGKARGFVPASQLVSDEGHKSEDNDDRFAGLVGITLQLKVIELDRSRNRLILSERQAMREWRRHQKEKLLSELQIGDVRKGVVSSLAPFGAFVDLGGADGLIHLSELSWSRVQHPEEVVKINDEVEVKIISVDRERSRIGLSLRQLQPEPWTVIHEKYAIGQLVEAEITRLTTFGAFARIENEIEGLIHISELSDKRISHPKEVVQQGQTITVRVIKIEPDRRRIGLSLRRVAEEEYAVIQWEPETEEEADEEPTAMASAMIEAEAESAEAQLADTSENTEPTDEAVVEEADTADSTEETAATENDEAEAVVMEADTADSTEEAAATENDEAEAVVMEADTADSTEEAAATEDAAVEA